jgi:hypothetical protein
MRPTLDPEPVPVADLRIELRKATQTDKPNVVEGQCRAFSLPDLLDVAEQVAFTEPGYGYCLTRALEVDGLVSVTTAGAQVHYFDQDQLVGVIVRWPEKSPRNEVSDG